MTELYCENSRMSLPLKANEQKAEATAALPWISLHASLTAKFQTDCSSCSFHLLTPPSYLSVPLPGSYLRKVSHESHKRPLCFQTQYSSQLRRLLWGRRHPYFLLSESLPSLGLGDGVFVGVSSLPWHFLLDCNCLSFVFFLHLLFKHRYSLDS